jgi:hypothetical protein
MKRLVLGWIATLLTLAAAQASDRATPAAVGDKVRAYRVAHESQIL